MAVTSGGVRGRFVLPTQDGKGTKKNARIFTRRGTKDEKEGDIGLKSDHVTDSTRKITWGKEKGGKRGEHLIGG